MKSLTEDVSEIVDMMIRLSADITWYEASDIYYNIQELHKVIKSKNKLDKIILFNHDDGVLTYNCPLAFPYYGIDKAIQIWRITHDPETCTTIFKRVCLMEEN